MPKKRYNAEDRIHNSARRMWLAWEPCRSSARAHANNSAFRPPDSGHIDPLRRH